MLATKYCGMGAKEGPELVIFFQLTFIQLEYTLAQNLELQIDCIKNCGNEIWYFPRLLHFGIYSEAQSYDNME